MLVASLLSKSHARTKQFSGTLFVEITIAPSDSRRRLQNWTGSVWSNEGEDPAVSLRSTWSSAATGLNCFRIDVWDVFAKLRKLVSQRFSNSSVPITEDKAMAFIMRKKSEGKTYGSLQLFISCFGWYCWTSALQIPQQWAQKSHDGCETPLAKGTIYCWIFPYYVTRWIWPPAMIGRFNVTSTFSRELAKLLI